ncbi:KxYKxGKxW signal peptide domain-containing protein [Enterococcus faecalis]|nr:KxYKxGKxW signal peptide domain-containing protein [Enterococcus faecalis]MBI0603803.1 KxYKxGKxW signal peptide domain-containing protein [Enterococcus faecalis]
MKKEMKMIQESQGEIKKRFKMYKAKKKWVYAPILFLGIGISLISSEVEAKEVKEVNTNQKLVDAVKDSIEYGLFPQQYLTANKLLSDDVKINTDNMQVDRYIVSNFRNAQKYDAAYKSSNIIYKEKDISKNNFYNTDTGTQSGKALFIKINGSSGYAGYELKLMPNTNYKLVLDSQGQTKKNVISGEGLLREGSETGRIITKINNDNTGSAQKVIKDYSFTTPVSDDLVTVKFYITKDSNNINPFELKSNGDWFVTADIPNLEMEKYEKKVPLTTVLGDHTSDVINEEKDKIKFFDKANNNTLVKTTINVKKGNPITSAGIYYNEITATKWGIQSSDKAKLEIEDDRPELISKIKENILELEKNIDDLATLHTNKKQEFKKELEKILIDVDEQVNKVKDKRDFKNIVENKVPKQILIQQQ